VAVNGAVLTQSGTPASAEHDLTAIKTYAAELQLKRFVLTGPIPTPAEYELSSDARGAYRETGRRILVRRDSVGRSRIKAPFRLFGHVACTESEGIGGLFWCGDLLRRGYFFAHLPTSRGPKQVSLFGQFARNLLQRSGLHRKPVADPQRVFRTLTRVRTPRYEPEAGRILMIIPNFIRGGCERRMVVTTVGLIRRGYDVRILGFDPLDRSVCSLEDDITKLGITPQFCKDFRDPSGGGGWSRAPGEAALAANLSELPRWIRDKIGPVSAAILHHRPTAVHTWLDGPAVIGGLASCALGVPHLILAQASMSAVHYSGRPDHLLGAYRYVAGNPNTILLNNSLAGAADYARWLGRRTRAIHVVYNGFLPEMVRTPLAHELSQFRARLGFPPGVPVVGGLIRFVEEKDPDLWLETAAKISAVRPDIRFLLVGEGILYDHAVHRAAALGLAERMILPGAISDVGLAYATLDVVLLTSAIEGLPNVLLEAQAAGRPIVTTNVGGAREAVLENRTGVVVDQRSAEHLAQAVLTILSDDAWRTRLRSEGPSFVAERFGFERMISQTIEAYGVGRAKQV
jgi:glycosyltransferase involved in cell wall biosynthesis